MNKTEKISRIRWKYKRQGKFAITKTYFFFFFLYVWFFFVVKMKIFTGKFLNFFLIFAQNIDCEYSLEPPRRGGSNVYPQSMF